MPQPYGFPHIPAYARMVRPLKGGSEFYIATLLEHVHSWPAYALLALTLTLLVISLANHLNAIRSAVIALLAIELVQIAIGLYQARNALPPLAVGVHMVLAAVLVAACTTLVLRLKHPADGVEPN